MGSLVVRTWCFRHCSLGSIPGLGTEVPHQALHTVAKNKQTNKQTKTPDEWIKKDVEYIYNRYTHILSHKKHEISSTTTCMDLDGITLSEVRQTKTGKYCVFLLICGI